MVPTIGIGAGPHCDGQILVYSDMVGLTIDFSPRFVRRYDNLQERISHSVDSYIQDIRNCNFPQLMKVIKIECLDLFNIVTQY